MQICLFLQRLLQLFQVEGYTVVKFFLTSLEIVEQSYDTNFPIALKLFLSLSASSIFSLSFFDKCLFFILSPTVLVRN